MAFESLRRNGITHTWKIDDGPDSSPPNSIMWPVFANPPLFSMAPIQYFV